MDKEKFELGLGELKEQVLRIHRVAGQLDEIVQNIENGMIYDNDDMNYFFVKACHARQHDCLNAMSVSELDTKEELAWKTLFSAFDKEES